ncbi:hypothetical protein [Anaerotignum propionicum]|nr:hypothetical protein [Anaerotignum propionicum]
MKKKDDFIEWKQKRTLKVEIDKQQEKDLKNNKITIDIYFLLW